MKTILMVDDDKLNLAAAGNVLKDTYEVVSASGGAQALEYLENGECDLILLDISMPEMDGFEVLDRIRAMERCRDIPVIFLTANSDPEIETRCFQMGAADFIMKPFVPSVMLSRINGTLELAQLRRGGADRDAQNTGAASESENEPDRDALTGLRNRAYMEKVVSELLVRGTAGALLLVDIDNFKHINDNFGHIAGDQILKNLANVLRKIFSREDILCRVGGDEFAIFTAGAISKEELDGRVAEMISETYRRARECGFAISSALSVGIAQAPEDGSEFNQLYSCADKALYFVKKNGKGSSHFFSEQLRSGGNRRGKTVDLKYLQDLMNQEDKGKGAYLMDFESFHHVYNFIHRFIDRNNRDVQIVLFTVSENENMAFNAEETEYALGLLERAVYTSLRRSDVSTRYSSRQLIVILMDTNTQNGDRVAERILENFNRQYTKGMVRVDYGIARMNALKEAANREDWIVVVDDDAMNLEAAKHIFNEAKIRAQYFESGQSMLEYLDGTRAPALILLDVHMPEMDGFEVLKRLRQKQGYHKVPVIFLTTDDDREVGKRGLNAGAADFVKKPFEAEILLTRVNNAISLYRLQNEMARELKIKTDKLSHVYLEIVRAMSMAIDAKDTYTKGHSTRVAEYARRIAERAGYSEQAQEQVYIMGLLHDMGKIGIPDAIINKPGRLTEEEFEVIKTHSQIGAQILQSISEFPELSIGARWHHERYDGTGYPDGLRGTEIPETARIITVADTYDAMTSRRSYRKILPQSAVKAEFVRCSGTQFDPKFADIMIQLIDEDRNFKMKEL